MRTLSLKLFCLFLFIFSLQFSATSCSMYKVTLDGKTIVGNNEDFTTPNAQFIFEPGTVNNYGAMYMSFLDEFIQGGVNDQGLMFDGFFEPFLEVKNTEGKEDIYIGDALKHTLRTMTTCEEVQDFLSTINLKVLENGQLVFVDRSGTYLVIEGDEMFLGNEAEKTFSNFYYSQTESLEDVPIDFYQNGRAFLNSSEPSGSLDYCSQAMSSFSQKGLASTQYSTLYDLENNTVRVHLFGDFENHVTLDLSEEFKKGEHKVMIPELFPVESEGYQYYLTYNDTEHPTALLEKLLGDESYSEEELVSFGIQNVVIELGQEWLNYIENPGAAIKVFQYGISLTPSVADLHYFLGKSYAADKQYEKAISSYKQALKLNPDDPDAARRIEEVMKQMD